MSLDQGKPKIILSGGGTMGSVTPLLILAEELKSRYDFVFIGTRSGVEREIVSKINYIKYRAILSGKWRRYFSLVNLWDLFKIKLAFFQSLYILLKLKPALVISAGAYVSVPLAWAAYFLKITVLIHQQDIRPGLANRLMAKTARVITTVFEKSVADYGAKAVWVGNPVQGLDLERVQQIIQAFQVKDSKPLLIALGGGTGSQSLNQLLAGSLEEITSFCQVIHITGANKQVAQSLSDNYQSYEFLPHEKLLALLFRADLVLSRAGLGVLTELSSLGKATLLMPMPNSHQEDNANYFAERQAAIVLKNEDLNSEHLIEKIKMILSNQELKENLGYNIKRILPSGANESLKLIITSLVENSKIK